MLEIVVFLLGLLLSMAIHEAVHAYTSHSLGDDTAYLSGRLTLNPLAHIDPFATVLLPILLIQLGLPPFAAAKPVPFNPSRVRYGEFGAALVGIAGPISNLLIAIFLGIWARIFIGFDDSTLSELFEGMIFLNVSLFVFNMIPYPPLDGSRLLYALAPDGLRRVMTTIESTGLMGLVLFMFVIFRFISPIMINAVDWLMRTITGIS